MDHKVNSLSPAINKNQTIFGRTPSGSFSTTFNTPVRFGNAVDNTNHILKGLLDEISLYSRALTVGEIVAIFNSDYKGKTKP